MASRRNGWRPIWRELPVCLVCGQPVRIERYFLGEWVHIERFTDPNRLGQ
jgi:hypothetical protein